MSASKVRIAEGALNSLFCRLNEWRLQENADHISPLQSWGPEIRNFGKLPRRPIVHGDCDIVIEKPTFIMKIDASKYKDIRERILATMSQAFHRILSSC